MSTPTHTLCPYPPLFRSGGASVGDPTIGNWTLGVDTSASVEASISISASGNVSHDSTIGNVVIGDLVTDEGVNADVEYSLMVEATADGTGTATIGDVTIGAIEIGRASCRERVCQYV